jgi:hypothetical protein
LRPEWAVPNVKDMRSTLRWRIELRRAARRTNVAYLVGPASAGLGLLLIAIAILSRGYAGSSWAASVDVGLGLVGLIGTGMYRGREMVGVAIWALTTFVLLALGLAGIALGMPGWWIAAHFALGVGYLGLVVAGGFVHPDRAVTVEPA